MTAGAYGLWGDDRDIDMLTRAGQLAVFSPTRNATVAEEACAFHNGDYQDGIDRWMDHYANIWQTLSRRNRKGVSPISLMGYVAMSVLLGTSLTLGFWSVTKSVVVLSAGLTVSVVFPLSVACAFGGGPHRWWPGLRSLIYGGR